MKYTKLILDRQIGITSQVGTYSMINKMYFLHSSVAQGARWSLLYRKTQIMSVYHSKKAFLAKQQKTTKHKNSNDVVIIYLTNEFI